MCVWLQCLWMSQESGSLVEWNTLSQWSPLLTHRSLIFLVYQCCRSMNLLRGENLVRPTKRLKNGKLTRSLGHPRASFWLWSSRGFCRVSWLGLTPYPYPRESGVAIYQASSILPLQGSTYDTRSQTPASKACTL